MTRLWIFLLVGCGEITWFDDHASLREPVSRPASLVGRWQLQNLYGHDAQSADVTGLLELELAEGGELRAAQCAAPRFAGKGKLVCAGETICRRGRWRYDGTGGLWLALGGKPRLLIVEAAKVGFIASGMDLVPGEFARGLFAVASSPTVCG